MTEPALTSTTSKIKAAAFLISDRSRNITGETLNVAAGTHMRW